MHLCVAPQLSDVLFAQHQVMQSCLCRGLCSVFLIEPDQLVPEWHSEVSDVQLSLMDASQLKKPRDCRRFRLKWPGDAVCIGVQLACLARLPDQRIYQICIFGMSSNNDLPLTTDSQKLRQVVFRDLREPLWIILVRRHLYRYRASINEFFSLLPTLMLGDGRE